MTGQPVEGPGQLLLATGGGFFNNLSGYLAEMRIAPVYDRSANDNFYITRSSNDTDVSQIAASALDATHDLVVIQLARDPLTGTTVLNAYGLDAPGTTAAGWYFANVVAPDLASYTDAWYVYTWTDDASDGPSDASEFVLQGSGT
jgi:hypothetical protein